jgi:hypothetical protein
MKLPAVPPVRAPRTTDQSLRRPPMQHRLPVRPLIRPRRSDCLLVAADGARLA